MLPDSVTFWIQKESLSTESNPSVNYFLQYIIESDYQQLHRYHAHALAVKKIQLTKPIKPLQKTWSGYKIKFRASFWNACNLWPRRHNNSQEETVWCRHRALEPMWVMWFLLPPLWYEITHSYTVIHLSLYGRPVSPRTMDTYHLFSFWVHFKSYSPL